MEEERKRKKEKDKGLKVKMKKKNLKQPHINLAESQEVNTSNFDISKSTKRLPEKGSGAQLEISLPGWTRVRSW